MKFQGIIRMKAALATAALGVLLAACSAGGGGNDKSTSGTPVASDLIVSLSKSTITSTGADTSTLTVTAVDANRNAVASIPVTVTPDSGAIYSTTSNSTSSAGTVSGTVGVGTDHSNRTITISIQSGSIKKTASLDVTGATLSATAGTGTSGSSTTIQYTLLDGAAAPIAGASITVQVPGQADVNAKTDTLGKYSFPLTMPSTSTVITAKAAGVSTTSTVTPTNGTTVIPDAGTVTSASLSANPTSVSTSKTAELRALFIGASNAPIPNVRVHFMMDDSNSIGGTLSTDASDGSHNVVYSDANGVARSTYTAGTRGGVITPKVCWSSVDFTSTDCSGANEHVASASSLTVVSSGVSLAVFTNGTITEDATKNIYSISVIVQVVDASNQPISGSTVTPSVDIPRFYRGIYGVSGGRWAQGIYVRSGSAGSYTYAPSLASSVQSCDNEDINRNNIMETGEDANSSGSLEPFKASVAIVPTSTGSNVTDSFGKAYFELQYGENYASWEDVVMTFTTTVEGTEGHATYPTSLPVPSSVVTKTDSTPPFWISPYNVPNDGVSGTPWIVGTTAVTNPGVIYPTTTTFNLCNAQQ
jgi:hypothetical protein